MVVEVTIYRCCDDRYIRMRLFHPLHALGRGQKTEEADVLGACLLQKVNRRRRGIAGGQHGIDDDGHTVFKLGRNLEVILHRLERLGIAVEPDKPHPRGGDQLENTVEQTIARPQDRDERELLAYDHRRVHFAQGRLDALGGHRQLAGDLIGQKQADLAQKLTEGGGRGILLAHQGQLVLNQRVIDDGQMVIGHCAASSFLAMRSRVAASQKAASSAVLLSSAKSASYQP